MSSVEVPALLIIIFCGMLEAKRRNGHHSLEETGIYKHALAPSRFLESWYLFHDRDCDMRAESERGGM